ncbi:Adenine deaminase [Kingella negevensis]|uniref:Adenine deaminase n=1 Tax=Kingella negevensis TaxID=1522312 RepID=A0A238HG57_9NEIS|nr:Adenine deaminase [Kingella negevensis]
MLHEQDFFDLTYAYLQKCRQDNVTYTEIFFDTERGVAFETVLNGIVRACDTANCEWSISSALIMCFLRHLSEESAFETLAQSLPHRDKIIGVGLDYSEVSNPPSKFTRVFAHAGEEGSPDYVCEALDLLHVSRIDHGVRSEEDEDLMARLIAEQMPLTVYPLNNLKLKVVDNMREHNLHRMLQRGVLVTVNSDDPAYFGSYVNDNFVALANAFDLSAAEIAQLCKNSFQATFISDDEKQKWFKQIDDLLVA